MDTCVLIPEDFSLVLTLHPNPRNIMEMSVAIWTNRFIEAGTLFHPDQGIIRLDKLEIYSNLDKDDIRNKFGCWDTVHEVEERKVRHCNWVRFLKSSRDVSETNVIAKASSNESAFYTTRPLKPNEEIIVFFEEVKVNHLSESEDVVDIDVEDKTDSSTQNDILMVGLPRPSALLPSPVSRDDDCRSNISDLSSVSDDVDLTDGQAHPTHLSTIEEDTVECSHGGRQSISAPRAEDANDECRPKDLSLALLPSIDDNMNESLQEDHGPAEILRASHSPVYLNCDVPIKRSRERNWLPCEVCGKKFDRPSLLKRHMRTHTGEKPHACDVCGKSFSTSSSLNTHRRIHSGEKPHQCTVCGKRFTASSNLYYHKMTHDKEKPHKCQLCSKSFPTPGDLRSHMYVHNGSWPYRCEICNRGFSKQTNLKNHLMLHTGDKPHECDVCGKKFALQCNLKSHLKTHENEVRDACIHCGKKLPVTDKGSADRSCADCRNKIVMSPLFSSRKRPSDFSISKITDSEISTVKTVRRNRSVPMRGESLFDTKKFINSQYYDSNSPFTLTQNKSSLRDLYGISNDSRAFLANSRGSPDYSLYSSGQAYQNTYPYHIQGIGYGKQFPLRQSHTWAGLVA